MSTVDSLLATLESSNIRLGLDENKNIKIRGDKRHLTSALIGQIKQHKAQLVSLLSGVSESHSEPINVIPRDQSHYPLSFVQKRLWFIDQMGEGSNQYNMFQAVSINGNFKVELAEQAFSLIIQRHEALRTVFEQIDDEPWQAIREQFEFTILQHDVSDLAIEEQTAKIEQIINQRAAVVFDLCNDLMLKVDFIRQSDRSGVLLCNMHHIASDGWSLGILFAEFNAFYQQLSLGQPARLAPLPVQYVDFSAWQNQWLSTALQQQQLDYWQQKLADLPDVHGLPLDRPRPAEQSYRGAALSVAVDGATLTQLKDLALANGCTLFMLLHGALSLLIARHASEKDIAIGIPVANRHKEELKSLIGCFINTLVLRADCRKNKPFVEFLADIKQTNLEAQSNQDVSFEQVVERLKPRRSNQHSPLFQIAFTTETNDGSAQQSQAIEIQPYRRAMVAAKYELILYAGETPQGMNFEFEYNCDLFDAERIEALAQHWLILLKNIINNPKMDILALPILSESESQFLLQQVQGQTRQAHLATDSILAQFEAQVARDPAAVAVTFEGHSLTYGELNGKANQVAHCLVAKGVGRETLVGLSLARTIEIPVGILAILKAGGAYVPLDSAYPAERLSYMIENSGLKLVLTHSDINGLQTVEDLELLCLDTMELDQYSRDNLSIAAQPDQLAYVIYTSGSTGMPKGVMVEHGQLRRLFACCDQQFNFGADDVWCLFHSYAFDFSVWEFWGALAFGGRLVIVGQLVSRTPEDFYRLVVDEKVTVLNQTPTAFSQFNLQDQQQRDTLFLRTVVFGGEALNLAQLSGWIDRHGDQNIALVNMYGITETTVHVTYRRIFKTDIEQNQGSLIGRPLADLSVLILDDLWSPVPMGTVAQMYVGGDGVTRGYLNNPALTAERFIENPFHNGQKLYKTGDLARWVKPGELEYLGRMDDQVKIRGFRIELGEIEHHICAIEQIDSALVQVSVDADQQQVLLAYVVPNSDYQPEKTALPLHVLPNNHAIAFQNISEADFLYHEIYEEKSYVKQGIVLCDNAVVLDVGANIGMFSLFVGDICPSAQIYAFEPSGPVYQTLAFNAKRHNSKIKTFNFGLSDSTKSMEFTFYPSNTVMSGVYSDVEQDKKLVKDFMINRSALKGDGVNASAMDEIVASRFEQQQITCQFRALFDVIAEQEISRIDLLKIDVEKAELDVLSGITEEVWAIVDQLIIEVHDIDGRLAFVEDLLIKQGFIVAVEQEDEAKNTALYNIYGRKSPVDEQVFAEFDRHVDKVVNTPAKVEILNERSIRQYLEYVLPYHMIPHGIMIIDSWPLTPNGKIDRKALPAPRHIAQHGQYEGPKTHAEHILVAIWSQLLKQDADSVNVHSNFFESGGDSILSTQLVARAAAQGLEITVKQLFEYQTIRQLALHAQFRTKVQASQLAQTGEAPLLPIAMRFFDDLTDKDHFNQSVMLSIDQLLSQHALLALTTALLNRHDALRLRFSQVDGQWQSQHVAVDETMIKQHINQFDLAEQAIGDAEPIMAQCQQGLDIENGPIWTINQIFNQRGDVRLLIIIHHLVVDGVSWRILLQDIQSALVQLKSMPTGDVKLAAKTSSFKQWGEFLKHYADDQKLQLELPMWQQIVATPVDKQLWLPHQDHQPAEDLPEICYFNLDKVQTEALLRQANKTYRTQINEILLASLLLSYQRWSSKKALRIDMEGHGREPLTDTLDLSETVGWFTSMFPVTLSSPDQDLETLICAVKEQYRAIPNHGIGFGVLQSIVGDETLLKAEPSAVVFNYLGQFDQSVDVKGEFSIAAESMGAQISPNRAQTHLVSINCIVSGEQLRCNMSYDKNQVSYSAVAAFADLFERALLQVIDHCVSVEKGKLTPSDFPLASISQTHLDHLSARYEIADLYPATAMQQGLLFFSTIDPSAYVTQIMMTFDNGFNSTSFVRAWQQLIEHHDVFKTAFVDNNQAQLLQLINEHASLDWEQDDISAMDPLAQQQVFETQRLLDKQKGFDIETAPLSRIHLWHLGNGRCQMLWSQHHALYDGWCLPILFAQLSELYRAQVNQRPLQLPPAKSFKHYVQWLTEQDHQQAVDFWRQQLLDVEWSGQLFGVNPASVRALPEHQSIEMSLTLVQTQQLQQMAAKTKVTVNILLQAAWAYLLGNYNYQPTVVFGSIVSGRPPQLDGVENMVGLFINTLPTRIDINAQSSIADWLVQIHQSQIEREQYSYCSLQTITDVVGVPAGESLFNSLLVFENYPVDESLADNSLSDSLTISELQVFEGTNYPITLMASVSDRLNLRLEYDASLYSPKLMSQVAEHLQILLMNISESETKQVSELTFLTAKQRHQLIKLGQGPSLEIPNFCIHQLIEAQAKRIPDVIAVVSGQRQLSYQALNQKANQLAHRLREQGLRTGQLVGISLNRDEMMIVALLAVLKAGAAYVPLDPNYPQERIAHIIADSGISKIIAARQWQDKFSSFTGQLLFSAEDDLGVQYSRDNINPKDIGLNPDHLAYVIYTSGSTGLPKGVEIGHDNAMAMIGWAGQTFTADELSRTLCSTSLNFDLSVFELFVPLSFGHQCVVVNNALDLLTESLDVTLINTVPSAMQALLVEEAIPLTAKVINLAGEPLSRDLLNGVLELPQSPSVYNLYGPSEDTTYSTFAKFTATLAGTPDIGRPISNTQAYLLTPWQTIVPQGGKGELYLAGAGVTKGYRHNKPLTDERYLTNPFANAAQSAKSTRMYKTGDLVRMTEDGHLNYIGRIDDQVKIRGFRIELGEINNVLGQCDWVHSAAVVVDSKAFAQPTLVGYFSVVADAPPSMEAEAIRSAVRRQMAAQLPDYMVPKVLMILAQMPLTPNGKVDRKSLPSPIVDETAPSFIDASLTIEKQLQQAWMTVLQQPRISINDNFFELGGNSLLTISLKKQIEQQCGLSVAITDIFEYPTIATMAQFLDPSYVGASRAEAGLQSNNSEQLDIAVIAMSGRFPDATDIASFWRNLCNGHESLHHYSDEQLLAAGLPESLVKHQDYVKSGVMLQDFDQFDASYFGFTPKEAQLMDPQQRLLFECANEALESGGYGDKNRQQSVGVFVGTGNSLYLLNHLLPQFEALNSSAQAIKIGNDRDFAATRLAYKLNLIGPAVNVSTACSTSLVAIHQACISLRLGESRMALAGGATLANTRIQGYMYQQGDILSPDGHCRAFDEQAAGTRAGDGAGVVLLKRLEDALSDGDQIYAVIKGSAVNNDGADKIGFTAPSVAGQAEVITAALRRAKISPDTIQYVEAHGTGTQLGDPIEVKALSKAYQGVGAQHCALGSVKANIGHLDAAAGVTGLIKTVLALSHKQLPPSINYQEGNHQIDFTNSPFYVNAELRDWPQTDGPRRAAVSSFGIGGTNAHIVLEQAPVAGSKSTSQADEYGQLLVLSAKTDTALSLAKANLAEYLLTTTDPLRNIAFTLQVGRQADKYRYALVTKDHHQGAEQLLNDSGLSVNRALLEGVKKPLLVYMFSGQGAQYVRMVADLYLSEPCFKQNFDLCAQMFQHHLHIDLKETLLLENASEVNSAQANEKLGQTLWAQPLLFAVEYSLSQLLASWSIEPDLMIGHSVGEYVAACLAGVFSLADAIKVLAARARLMQQTEPGKMLSTAMTQSALAPLLEKYGCWMAAVNSPRNCVASGTKAAITALAEDLKSQKVACHLLANNRAFHSALMTPIAAKFALHLAEVQLNPPHKPFVSNVTGKLIEPQQAMDPDYWVQHLLGTVHFAEGINTLVTQAQQQQEALMFIEIGPGAGLSTLASKHPKVQRNSLATLLNHQHQTHSEREELLWGLAKLWANGVEIDWSACHLEKLPGRVALPTYPFERQRFWVEPLTAGQRTLEQLPARRLDIEQWLYQPSWTMKGKKAAKPSSQGCCLLLMQSNSLFDQMSVALQQSSEQLIVVNWGASYVEHSDSHYCIDPNKESDYRRLFETLAAKQIKVTELVHCWGLDSVKPDELSLQVINGSAALMSLFNLCQTMELHHLMDSIKVKIIATELFKIVQDDVINPLNSPLYAVPKSILHEFIHSRWQIIDVGAFEGSKSLNRWHWKLLLEDLQHQHQSLETVAYRGGRRWEPNFTQIEWDHQDGAVDSDGSIKSSGVYLITGGLGGVGFALASKIAQKYQSRLLLLGRTAVPPADQWSAYLASEDYHQKTYELVTKLHQLQQAGSEVMYVQADVSHIGQLNRAVDQCLEHFGQINGVIHAAGIASGGVMQLKQSDHIEQVIASKVYGTWLLHQAVGKLKLDFFVMCSSITVQLGGFGQFDYVAANAFEDSFAQYQQDNTDIQYLSINWDSWNELGMSAGQQGRTQNQGIEAEQGLLLLEAALQQKLPQIVISVLDFNQVLEQQHLAMQQLESETLVTHNTSELYSRPDISTPYVEASNEFEQQLAQHWQGLLGLEKVGVNDSFLELGGDSLLAIQVFDMLKQKFGIDNQVISMKDFYQLPTISTLAVKISEHWNTQKVSLQKAKLASQGKQVEQGLL